MERQDEGVDCKKMLVKCLNQRCVYCVYFFTRFGYEAPTVELTKE